MENLYRASRIEVPKIRERSIAVQNPIELDNKAFNIENGDKKMLDYLDYSSTLTKGALAANGTIKLHPKENYPYLKDYGAYSPYRKDKVIEPDVQYESDEDFDYWDNIFLSSANSNNFFENAINT